MQNRQLDDKFMLRLPDGWRDELKIAAATNGRSMNAEIIQRLKPTVQAGDGPLMQSRNDATGQRKGAQLERAS